MLILKYSISMCPDPAVAGDIPQQLEAQQSQAARRRRARQATHAQQDRQARSRLVTTTH